MIARRILAAALAALLCCTAASAAGVQPTASDASRASAAYADLIARFWRGDANYGHLNRFTTEPVSPGATVETAICKGCLWEYSMGVHPLYAQWKITGSSDALARLKAMWRWISTTWSLTDVSTCGVVSGTTSTAQDDAAWSSVMFVGPLYEATGDPNALAYGKAVMDCAYNRWGDSDGGLFYFDQTYGLTALSLNAGGTGYTVGSVLKLVGGSVRSSYGTATVKTVDVNGATLTFAFTAGNYAGTLPTTFATSLVSGAGSGATFQSPTYSALSRDKTSYMAPLAWAMLDYSVKTGDSTYQAKAVAIDAFAAADLTQGRPADGLYWVDVNGSTYADLDGGSPYNIRKGGSVTMLGGNMGFAALDARLYAITGTASYKTRALATAAGINAYERIGAVLMNDRDAYVDGWAAYFYATTVVPLLPATGTADAGTILATARAVGSLARAADATYAADWDGTPSVWATASPGYSLTVSGNGAIWPIVGQLFGK